MRFCRSLVAWMWLVALAPPLLGFMLCLGGWVDPAASVPMPPHSGFRSLWRLLLITAASTLTFSMLFFRTIAARFGPDQPERWPFYSAFLAVCLSAVLSIGFAVGHAYPE